eukprot:XP_014061744.1 PREDICTED: ATP-dependent RNA helicase DDX1-like [Salmo salar]
MAAFSELGVMPEIAQAVEEMDWLLPTDIQAESIPLILGGGDVLMAAETGSGKTGAFTIPVIQIVYETLKDQQEGKKGRTAVKTGGAGKTDRQTDISLTCRQCLKWAGAIRRGVSARCGVSAGAIQRTTVMHFFFFRASTDFFLGGQDQYSMSLN